MNPPLSLPLPTHVQSSTRDFTHYLLTNSTQWLLESTFIDLLLQGQAAGPFLRHLLHLHLLLLFFQQQVLGCLSRLLLLLLLLLVVLHILLLDSGK